MPPVAPDLDPADAQHRRDLAARLRAIRINAGYTASRVADALGVTRPTVSMYELRPNPNQVMTVMQRHARALDHVAAPVLHNLHIPRSAEMDMLEALSYGVDADRADQAARLLLGAQLGAARRHQELPVRSVADALGFARTNTVLQIEECRYGGMVASAQRYARALGGWLTIELEPIEEYLEDAA